MAMTADEISAAKMEEAPTLVNDVSGSALLLTNGGTLPLNWKARVLRVIATNQDNDPRILYIYIGDATNEERTELMRINLTNYETRIFEVIHPEKDQIRKWESRTTAQSNLLYGYLDGAPTVGVLVESLDWIMEEG